MRGYYTMIFNKHNKAEFLLLLCVIAGLVFNGCAKSSGDSKDITVLKGISAPPTNLTYTTTSAVYTLDMPIANNLPSITGVVTEWSVDPELPSGLELDTATGVISGTPAITQAAAHYRVTAGNDYGFAAAIVSITVNIAPPAALSYSTTACVYTIDEPITHNTPTVTGTVTSWSVEPSLPGGLSMDPETGIITGTPDLEQTSETYTIMAANDYGSATATISITVNTDAPTALSYTTTSCVYTKDLTITPNTPIVTGSVTSWSVEPSLPGGLSMDPDTGIITGTPDLEQPADNYVITASNSGGVATTMISIAINLDTPSALSYETTSCVYTKDLVIDDNEPTVTGTITEWSVEPALPHGLTLNTTTGVISGTPDIEQVAVEYTITATNTSGATTATISITVNLEAPSALSYETTSCVYTEDLAITPNTPTVTGSVASWSVEPALPDGLMLDATTGVISGVPEDQQYAAEYTVTAANSGGSTTTVISITVNGDAPSSLSYAMTSCVYTKDLVITSNVPTLSGTALAWTSVPALPHGLILGSDGVISGTPDTEQATLVHTITAYNNGGSVSTDISITVNLAEPSGLSYSNQTAVYTRAFAIQSNTPNVTGTISTWSVDPALPAGLMLNTTTGVITGTPTTNQAAANYLITASNSGGAVTSTISITINEDPPSGLTYSAPNASYLQYDAIAPNMPTVAGTITSWSVDPALPTGLTLNTTTGVITGTPTVEQTSASYTVTATNSSFGSTTATVSIAVSLHAPAGLSYSAPAAAYTLGSPIANNVPTITGIIASWSVDRPLPSGLVLDTSTGIISGTPDTEQAIDTYTITATNAAGSTTATISISVAARMYPRFVYAANFNDSTVSCFTADGTTGRLRHDGYAATGANPHYVVTHTTGKFVYTLNYSGRNISVYTIDQSTGRLSQGTTVGAGINPHTMAIDPSGRFAYVANAGEFVSSGWGGSWSGCNVQMYGINQTTGALTSLGTAGAQNGPKSVAVDPTGRFVYVANGESDSVSAFSINQTSGTLTGIGSVGAGDNPYSIAVDPTGRFVYAANQNGDTVSVYTINQTTGALTAGTAVAGGDGPTSVKVDPSGRFVYVANINASTISLFTIDQATGELTAGTAASTGTSPRSITIDPTGLFAYVPLVNGNAVSLFTIDQTSGELTLSTTVNTHSGPFSIATVSGSAPLAYVPKSAYVANTTGNSVSVYAIDRATGALTAGGSAAAGTNPRSVALDPFGRFVYTANFLSKSISAYTIDQSTGALSEGTTVNAELSPMDVAVDPSGRYAYATYYDTNTILIYAINQSTGALTAGTAVSTGVYPNSVTFDPLGRFAYVANYSDNTISVYTINKSTGALTAGTAVAAGSGPCGIAIDPLCRFAYAVNYIGNTISVYTINQSSGALTAGMAVAAGTNPRSVAVDPYGRFAYAVNYGDNSISVYSIDQATGALTAGAAVPAGTRPCAVEVDPSGSFVYATNYGDNTVAVYSIDQSTGSLTGVTAAASGLGPRSISTRWVVE